MKTKYEQHNADFSKFVHYQAREKIYPLLFCCDQKDLVFDNTLLESGERGKVLDGELAIDLIVGIKPKCMNHLKSTINISFQERFRDAKPDYMDNQDITITEWNYASDLPSELYKIQADYFIYGFYNMNERTFLDTFIINVLLLKQHIIQNKVHFKVGRNKKKQSFIAITYKELKRCGLIDYYFDGKQMYKIQRG